MGLFKKSFTDKKADKYQKTLNREIRGEKTDEDEEVPPLGRQFLEHRAEPNEHPPV